MSELLLCRVSECLISFFVSYIPIMLTRIQYLRYIVQYLRYIFSTCVYMDNCTKLFIATEKKQLSKLYFLFCVLCVLIHHHFWSFIIHKVSSSSTKTYDIEFYKPLKNKYSKICYYTVCQKTQTSKPYVLIILFKHWIFRACTWFTYIGMFVIMSFQSLYGKAE